MTFATDLICNILKVFLILHSSHLHCHTFHALALHLHYHHVRIQHLLHKLVVCSMVAPFVLVLHPIIMADYSMFATNLMVSIICFSFYVLFILHPHHPGGLHYPAHSPGGP